MGGNGRSDAGGSEALDGVAVHNEKYIVFKRDDFHWENGQDLFDITPKDEVSDAVVIRLQDVFAESALWTYANEIRAALEILWLMGHTPDGNEIVQRLDEIAEYFAEMANAAGRARKKVPD